jgi:adenosylhomocysteine nucleosidase
MSGRLAFVCAMPMEMAPLRRPLHLRTTDTGPPRLYQGVLDGRPVAAVTTGMGPELARRGMDRLLSAVDVERVVVVGITGAVENETPIGTLIQPEKVVDGATGVAYRPHTLGHGEHAGTMWTTAELITDLDRVAALRADGVVALDMETAAIGAACDPRGIPWSVVRVISDRASDGSIDQEMFAMSNQDGTLKPMAALAYMVRHPRRLPELARMGRQVRGATKRAASLAVDAVREHWRAGGH